MQATEVIFCGKWLNRYRIQRLNRVEKLTMGRGLIGNAFEWSKLEIELCSKHTNAFRICDKLILHLKDKLTSSLKGAFKKFIKLFCIVD